MTLLVASTLKSKLLAAAKCKSSARIGLVKAIRARSTIKCSLRGGRCWKQRLQCTTKVEERTWLSLLRSTTRNIGLKVLSRCHISKTNFSERKPKDRVCICGRGGGCLWPPHNGGAGCVTKLDWTCSRLPTSSHHILPISRCKRVAARYQKDTASNNWGVIIQRSAATC